jgi:hypothetical protein
VLRRDRGADGFAHAGWRAAVLRRLGVRRLDWRIVVNHNEIVVIDEA